MANIVAVSADLVADTPLAHRGLDVGRRPAGFPGTVGDVPWHRAVKSELVIEMCLNSSVELEARG